MSHVVSHAVHHVVGHAVRHALLHFVGYAVLHAVLCAEVAIWTSHRAALGAAELLLLHLRGLHVPGHTPASS
jgi:hypothetical protein